MTASDMQSIAHVTPLAVREMDRGCGAERLIEVTGRIVVGMELSASRAQVRSRLAAVVGSYMTWLRPPSEFVLNQAAFGRLWWVHDAVSVLDIVVIDPTAFAEPQGALAEEIDQLTSAGVMVRLVAPEHPTQTRTLGASGWVTGWRWVP